MAELAHATAVARRTGAGWRAALLTGPSGAGKSDLALRLIAAGWRLVGDDYCHVWASQGALYVQGAPAIAGLIEARGVGLIRRPTLWTVRAALAVRCAPTIPERLPEPATTAFDGLSLPLVSLAPREASAPAKVDAALRGLGGGVALA